MSEQYECPICGFSLDFEPWHEYPSHDAQSDGICPCCGIHFGYDDFDESRDIRRSIHNEWRQEWIRNGMRWWAPELPPPHWDPVAQMRRSYRTTDDSVNTLWWPRVVYPTISSLAAEYVFRSVWTWLQQWPTKHYIYIINECGQELTVGHLVISEFAEGFQSGGIINAAKDALVRELWYCCPNGWDLDIGRSHLNRIHAYVNWFGHLRWGIWPRDVPTQTRQPHQAQPVWRALMDLNPPSDWLPQSIDDELLTKAFEHWPEPK